MTEQVEEESIFLVEESDPPSNGSMARAGRRRSNPIRFFTRGIPRDVCAGISAFVVFFVLLIAFSSSVVIPPGEIGIVVTLGKIKTLPPGLHFRSILISSVETLSGKTQLLEQENVIPTKEGLSVKLETAILYRIDTNRAGDLYNTVGVNYSEVLIQPEASSAIRGLTSESNAKALYTSGRSAIQESIKEDLDKSLGPRGIVIEDVLLKGVELPTELSKSIELKTKAEQDAQRMEFILQKERQEADRKSIEAEGIAAFQRIVSEGISPNLLMWKGIEATEKLAESSNSKIVMMGNNGQSLPVLLSADHPTSESSVGEAAPTPQAGQQSMSKASKVTSSPIAGEPAASPGQ